MMFAVACRPEKVAGVEELGDLVVSAREVHYRNEPGEPIINLHLATERIFPSISDYIDGATKIDGRTVTIFVRRVIEPPLGLGALGPATYNVTMPAIEGEYVLRVVHHLQVDEYSLVVTTAAIELRAIRTRFTRAAPARAWRYPRRSFVAACTIRAYLSTGTLERCNEFRDSLLAAVPLERIEFGAEGEVPYFTGTSLPGYEVRAEHYRYASEDDFTQVGAVIRSFGDRYPGTFISAQNWRNESHRSWPVPGVQ
jgi:hypothetical protein